MTYYNAIVKVGLSGKKYRNISNLNSFIRFARERFKPDAIFFYSSRTKSYVGSWHVNVGLRLL